MDRKSTSGRCFSLGSTMISLFSRKQTFVALSTIEVEYIATSVVSREVVWLRKLLVGLFDQELETTLIHCDNQSCVRVSKNVVFHDKLKHIEIKYHFIQDMVQLQYTSIDEQIVDILIKLLSKVKLIYFKDKLSVMQNVSLTEREC